MKLEDLKKIREKTEKDMLLRAGKTRLRVVVGMGTSGIAAGARETLKAFLDEIEKRDLARRHRHPGRRARPQLP